MGSPEFTFAVGDNYEDCAYHPCLCTGAADEELSGISLIDGSSPRSCSVAHCGPEPLTVDQAVLIKAHLAKYVELREALSVQAALEKLLW
jgi:hypothetical protein